MTAVKLFLQDCIYFKNVEDKYLEDIKKQLNIIQYILNTPNSIETRFLQVSNNLYFERIVLYGRVKYKVDKEEVSCRRLYHLVPSMSSLSKQIRFYLFFN